jgi:hypothetical protein
MSDQTVSALATQSGLSGEDLRIEPAERTILRGLAAKVAELAARPVEAEKRELWYRHNALQPTRPLIFCDPENGWNEIIRPDRLSCRGTLARDWEMRLRKEIYWAEEMQDDRVIQPVFDVAHVYTETDWGMHETKTGGEAGGSYVWDAPLKSYAEDLPRLRFPLIQVDATQSALLLALAEETLGDRLKVRLKTVWWWTLGMTWTLINLRGLQQMMFDMLDHPDELHAVMAFLRDGTLARLDHLERNGLLSLNNDGAYVGSGGFGWTHELPAPGFTGHVRTQDMWGFGESQETVGVSPAMFEEFIFPYQLPLLARFGLNCYGCCEPLDKRWRLVERFPHLRRVSVSPWSNQDLMAERLGPHYIFSRKPRPADLAMPAFDEDLVRRDLRDTMQIARRHDCRLEVIMKDNHTIANDPRRVTRWVEIAREEAERA